MSPNLHCNLVTLWQTPTSITYMCMMSENGVKSTFKNKDAIRALRMYIEWVVTQNLKQYTDEEIGIVKTQQERINDHIKEVSAIMSDNDLIVYYL